MLEVEMKFPVSDFAGLVTRLADWGVLDVHSREDTDQYFNAPDRDFGQTDEALRVRRIGVANFVTYKGPKIDAQTKTRTELEVPLGTGEAVAQDFMRLLQHLGYRPVGTVHKRRRIFHVERAGFPLEVCLDEVDGLGRFAELEIQAPEDRLDEARAVLLAAAAALGLTTSERRSYLQMLLARKEGQAS
jgi:adenylate cyclase class 2